MKTNVASQIVSTTRTISSTVVESYEIYYQNEREILALEVRQLIIDVVRSAPLENGWHKVNYRQMVEGTGMNAEIAGELEALKKQGKIEVTAEGMRFTSTGNKWANWYSKVPAVTFAVGRVKPHRSDPARGFTEWMPQIAAPTGVGEDKDGKPNGLMIQWANEISQSGGLGLPVKYHSSRRNVHLLSEGW